MPRLAGKQSNEGLHVSLLALTAIAIAVGLEYVGVINVVPGFGKDKAALNFNSYDVSSDQSVVSKSLQK
ncbi:MAG: hypothetical protein KME11_10785 [Timaviella obliquedivisa GSE-PSE-MK23-08B]|jgi:hypothetical protein|nr:hypothetical protein [Timaviella obliquedivisa GSE-PSE-MK23-08B]